MKKLICLMFVLGILLSTAGCISEIDTVKDKSIGVFHDVERIVPVPQFLSPYFKSSQSVPLNNIPNADMENWSVAWVGSGYTGMDFYEGGSSLKIYQPPSSTATVKTALSPAFTLQHEYISFYAKGYATLSYYQECESCSGATSTIEIYNDETLIQSKLIGYYNPTYTYWVQAPITVSSTGIYPTGTPSVGDDGKTWNRITVPISPYFVGKDVKIKIIMAGFSGKSNGGQPFSSQSYWSTIDNFYYSTSDGSEIYALEAPTAQFTYVVNGYDVTVDAGISQTVGTLYQIKWNWGDGTQTTGVTSDHKYNFPGNKQITLTIMDNENLVDTATLVVSVDGTSYYAGPQGSNTTNLPPIAGFSYGLTGMTITVDGSYSKDDGTISLYSWDFDGTKKNGITASHTYANAGSKTVTLIVKDNYGLESERKITFDLPIGGVTTDTNVVDNPGKPPISKFTYTLIAPTVTVDASESSDDVKIETYEWNWGDGTKSVGKSQSHTYSDMGTTRTITLTVTDNEGFTASSSATIQTISYNEPIDSNTSTYVAPPIKSGTSTPNPTTTSSNSFPLWGFLVFVGLCALFIGGIALLFGGKKKRPRRLGKKGGKKR